MIHIMHTILDASQSNACYEALKAHDARFDGSFFAAVTSTKIYCRPVCRVKTPKRENIRFYRLAAQAEAAGFRPCLRCRPELAPGTTTWSTEDASRILAQQASRMMDEPQAWGTASSTHNNPRPVRSGLTTYVAQQLGISDRHLRRIFEAQFGVSPLQYLQTRRLLAAKQLIADTRLPMTQIALSSGFSSVRRFNDAFVHHYGLNPSTLRRSKEVPQDQGITVKLGWRPPYDVAAMFNFLRLRALSALECVVGQEYFRTLQLRQSGRHYKGWMRIRFDEERSLAIVTVSDSLASVLPTVINRVRAAFDLDADPMAINTALGTDFPASEGLRVPGTPDGFELAVRAILGQQVTVAAARTLGNRFVEELGEPIETSTPGLDRLFPTPETLVTTSSDALGRLGITRQRQNALHALAQAVLAGELILQPGVDVAVACTQLRGHPGIGDWTAQYIAMRALRWPDAFPAGDVALQKALGVSNAKAATQIAERWRPWRSYAVLRAWQRLAHGTYPVAPNTSEGLEGTDQNATSPSKGAIVEP